MRYLITKEFKIDRSFLVERVIRLAEMLETNETEYESFIIFNSSISVVRIGILSKREENLIKRSYYYKRRKRILIRFYHSFELFCGPFADPSESTFNSGVEDSKFLGWVEITGYTVVGILYNRDIPDSLEQLKTICGISKQGI